MAMWHERSGGDLRAARLCTGGHPAAVRNPGTVTLARDLKSQKPAPNPTRSSGRSPSYPTRARGEVLAGIEDPVACGLHLAGAVFFAWQARKLVRRAGIARRRAAALAIFADSSVLVLGVSAFDHALAVDHPWKAWLQRADHAAIFLLIAGTLTPYRAIGFHGRGRWWMVGSTWVIALVWLALKIVFWSDVGDGLGLGLHVGLAAIGLGAFSVLPRPCPGSRSCSWRWGRSSTWPAPSPSIWTSAGSCRAGSAPTGSSRWRCRARCCCTGASFTTGRVPAVCLPVKPCDAAPFRSRARPPAPERGCRRPYPTRLVGGPE